MIVFNDRDLVRAERKLRDVSKKAFPHGIRNGLNQTAFEARKEWQGQLGKSMVLRNKYTERSVLVDKASGTNVDSMRSVVGSVLDYMETQEKGGSEAKKGKHGVTIPTSVSSGEGRGAKPRRKMVRGPNKLRAIQLGNNYRSGNRKQRNIVAVKMAKAHGRKYVFLELQRRKGLFRVSGGKRRTKIDMVWDLTNPSVSIPKNPTMDPAIEQLRPRMPGFFVEAMEAQLKRSLARRG